MLKFYISIRKLKKKACKHRGARLRGGRCNFAYSLAQRACPRLATLCLSFSFYTYPSSLHYSYAPFSQTLPDKKLDSDSKIISAAPKKRMRSVSNEATNLCRESTPAVRAVSNGSRRRAIDIYVGLRVHELSLNKAPNDSLF